MRGRLLLLVGTEDNHFPEYIHDRVIGDMASGLANRISGRAFGVAATGHSIQSERPRFLARTVLDFASQEMWALRAANGRFVTVSSDGPRRLVASSRMIGVWEQLRGIRQPNGEVAFEAASGHYLAAEDGGGREVVVDRFWIRSWERFEVVDLGDGNAAVRTTATRGRPVRYWQVRSDRGAEVHASAVAPSGDAVFRLIDLAGEPVRWRIGATTRFVGPVGRGFVVRSGAPVSVFRLVDLGRNEIAFHAPNGHFITAVTGGGAGLVAGGSSPGGWGVFVRDPIGDGSFLVRRGLRQYLVDRGGSLRADGTRAEATPMRFEPPAPVTVVEIAPEHRRAILGAVTRPFPEVIFRP